MKKYITILTILLALLLSACSGYNNEQEFENSTPASAGMESFEEIISEFATDIVVVQFVEERPFGNRLMEYEFIVIERIRGNAPDRILIYAEIVPPDFQPPIPNLEFNTDTEYLLPLIKINSAYANTHPEGFAFLERIVIDLNNPENSTGYDVSAFQHLIDVNTTSTENFTVQSMVSHFRNIPDQSSTSFEVIRSENIKDIINGSPFVLVVEIKEMRRPTTINDWMSTDFFYCTIIDILKGDESIRDVGDNFRILFFADTVQIGERHIVAVVPVDVGSFSHSFTSPHSLFSMAQLDEIVAILEEAGTLNRPVEPPIQQTATISVRTSNDNMMLNSVIFRPRGMVIEEGETAYSLLRKTGLDVVSLGTNHVVSINGLSAMADPFRADAQYVWSVRINGGSARSSSTVRDSDVVEWLYEHIILATPPVDPPPGGGDNM